MPIFLPEDQGSCSPVSLQLLIEVSELQHPNSSSDQEGLHSDSTVKMQEIRDALAQIKQCVESIKQQKTCIGSVILKVTLLTIFMVGYYMVYLEEKPIERVTCLALQAILMMGFYLIPSLRRQKSPS